MQLKTWLYLTAVCPLALGVSTASAGDLTPHFSEEAVQRGLLYAVRPWNPPGSQFFGFGCAIVDLNGNGHQDIVVMGRADGRVGVFKNDGNGNFLDRTIGSNIPVMSKGSGLAIADYNGNGLLDIYITQEDWLPNVLVRNDDNFRFMDVTEQAGVGNPGLGEGAAWGDFDNDGWLDLYVTNYTYAADAGHPERRNQLYRNLGDGTFESVGSQLGVDDHGMAFAAVWSDINRNGWLDLYVVNDRGHLPPMFRPNQLWRNDRGQMTNISKSSGANLGLWSMGVATGDFKGNGYPDFYITNLPNLGGYGGINPLLINQGDETFVEMAEQAGVHQFILSWGAMFFDYDNNGHLDLYVCNQTQANNLFANDGSFPATKVTVQAGVGGSQGYSYNAAYGDVTGNGALDLLLNNFAPAGTPPANVQLFINHEGAKRDWIRFNVVGRHPNHFAIGANIEVHTRDHVQWREIYAGGNNFKAQNELVFHFGLDDAGVAEKIVVNWPGGDPTRTLYNYPANHVWNVYPPEALGDADGNGVIDAYDLAFLLDSWGTVQPGSEMMDLNGDGVIDVTDLLKLLGMWSATR